MRAVKIGLGLGPGGLASSPASLAWNVNIMVCLSLRSWTKTVFRNNNNYYSKTLVRMSDSLQQRTFIQYFQDEGFEEANKHLDWHPKRDGGTRPPRPSRKYSPSGLPQ